MHVYFFAALHFFQLDLQHSCLLLGPVLGKANKALFGALM